jgi:hypothetical protein
MHMHSMQVLTTKTAKLQVENSAQTTLSLSLASVCPLQLVCKGLPVKDTPTYLTGARVMKRKSFILLQLG